MNALVDLGESSGRELYDHDAAKRAVRSGDPTRQRDHGLAEEFRRRRPADKEPVCFTLLVPLEISLPGEILPRPTALPRCGDKRAVFIDDADALKETVGEDAAFCEAVQRA